jgi:deoxyribodipyrimidine photo-lyase
LKILNNIGHFNDYGKTRNDLDKSTTQLSAYLKFGNISVRETYDKMKSKLGIKSELIKQIIWREFYAQLLYHNPQVLGNPLKEKYGKIKWDKNMKNLNAWKNGMTGFPIVDAGMREMNKTGYMHNRARLITASFLIKTLLINWEDGEKYFSQQLTDYDPASNNGNWQWVASTGADSQPYFRIFNPWSQSEKHDPDAEYIKKWIPELQDVPSSAIHQWNEEYENYSNVKYTKPIVDYEIQREKVLEMYKRVV